MKKSFAHIAIAATGVNAQRLERQAGSHINWHDFIGERQLAEPVTASAGTYVDRTSDEISIEPFGYYITGCDFQGNVPPILIDGDVNSWVV